MMRMGGLLQYTHVRPRWGRDPVSVMPLYGPYCAFLPTHGDAFLVSPAALLSPNRCIHTRACPSPLLRSAPIHLQLVHVLAPVVEFPCMSQQSGPIQDRKAHQATWPWPAEGGPTTVVSPLFQVSHSGHSGAAHADGQTRSFSWDFFSPILIFSFPCSARGREGF
jgi:hypothetical protein